jgi:hypothetical protein
MAPRAPAVRAAHLKDDLWAIGQLGAAARVRARLRPETVQAIEQALRTDHLPVALNAELAEAIFAELGEDGARRWGTSSFLHSLDGFFKPLFQGLTALVGPSPGLLFKAFPSGWLTTYRDCGSFEVSHPAPGLTRLLVRDLAPELRGVAYLTALCGTFESAFAISKYEGQVTLEPRAPDSREASWLVTWRATG